MKKFSQTILKRIASFALAIVCLLNLALSMTTYSRSTSSSAIGSNLALGSPILNKDAVSDNWNKYELIVWGIFLSNFCTPFIDDYESTFNLGSSSGSKGSGSKALSFASGSDVTNSSTIKDLTTYAINNQSTAAKPILVSYNKYEFGKYVSENAFSSATAADEDGSTTGTGGTGTGDASTGDANTGGTGSLQSEVVRNATLKDLFLAVSGPSGSDNGNYDESWTDYCWDGSSLRVSYSIFNENYPFMVGIYNANVPTFAVRSNSRYEIIFDYRNSYDIEMFSGAIAKALSSNYRSDVIEFLNGADLDSIPLYFDNFGNICARSGSDYLVIIPAAANQYLTKDKSINLVNSLIFNAGTSSTNTTTMTLMAGQSSLTKSWFENMISDEEFNIVSGSLAFTNDSYATKSGGMALFYDTDSLVIDNLRKSGKFDDTIVKSSLASQLSWWLNGMDSILEFLTNNAGTHTINKVHLGQLYKQLFDMELADESNTIQFKIEPVNIGESFYDGLESEVEELISATINSTSSLTNFLESSSGGVKRLTHLKDYSTGENIELFGDSVIVALQADDGAETNGKLNEWAVYRSIPSFLYKTYTGKINNKTYAGADKNFVTSVLNNSKTPVELMKNVVYADGASTSGRGRLSDFAKAFMVHNTNLYSIQDESKLGDIDTAIDGGAADLIALKDVRGLSGVGSAKFVYTNKAFGLSFMPQDRSNESLTNATFGRLAKVYYTSPVIEAVADILGVRDGTDFAVFSSNIYLTYLEWYNVSTDKLTGEAKSDLNITLFNEESLVEDITEITNVKSQEDMVNEITRYSYLMLHPTEGKTYRNEMMMSNFQSMIYEQYQRIVYGNASSYNHDMVTTRNNTGFLAVENYSENFLTSWFMSDYAMYAIYLIGIGIVIVVLVGTLKRRKITWFLLAMVLVVNVVLILPATGEIVPYIANNVVQDIFKDKMTYWSVSEQVANANTEKDLLNNSGSLSGGFTSGLSQEQTTQVYSLVQTIKSVYLDRYISIRQDISNKVTSTDNASYDEIQQNASTRWLLPMIMRQFTGDGGTADYVYVTLSDKLEDLSNMYWFYVPLDATYAGTMNGSDSDVTVQYVGKNSIDTESGRSTVWSDFTDLSMDTPTPTYRSIAYERNPNQLPHTYFYLLDNASLLLASFDSVSPKDYNSASEWAKAYAEHLKISGGTESELRVASDNIQQAGSSYNRYDRNSMNQVYGYLWNTESPLHYFYQTIKDSFKGTVSLGTVIGDLQGEYVTNTNTGEEYRKCFMMDDTTGKVRDILDLENMFKNVIPYMYSVQLMAGGTDGVSGMLGDSYVRDYTIYTDNLESWLFRSNWVTKIMENDEYSKPSTIYFYDSTGKRVKATVANQMIASCYDEAGRPMVFSEAQRLQLGLNEGDLSLIELKCIDINNSISKKWTLMLNYVGEAGLTREVVMRQMAVDATMEFSNSMTPTKLFNKSMKLYPDALDIRSISFDTIMCMLMLNVTHNTSFVYGDTMEVIIKDFDMFTVVLLLVVAFICSFLIPFIRCVVLAALFYMGYLSVVRSLFRDTSEKVQTSLGYMGCHIIYLVINICYLFVFKMLMAMTTSDEVLSVPTTEINTGNPVWCLIFVLIISIIYVMLSYQVLRFCIKNYKDMGWAVIKGTVEMVSMNMSAGFEKLGSKLAEAAETGRISDGSSGGGSSQDQSYNDISQTGTGTGGAGTTQPGTGGRGPGGSSGGPGGTGGSRGPDTYGSDDGDDIFDDTSPSYSYNSGRTQPSYGDPSDIDEKIERGRQRRGVAGQYQTSEQPQTHGQYPTDVGGTIDQSQYSGQTPSQSYAPPGGTVYESTPIQSTAPPPSHIPYRTAHGQVRQPTTPPQQTQQPQTTSKPSQSKPKPSGQGTIDTNHTDGTINTNMD